MDWADVEESVFETFFEWVVPALSLTLLGLVAAVVRLQVSESSYIALDLLLPTLFVAIIVWRVLGLRGADLSLDHRRTIAVWYALGIYTMLGLGVWWLMLGMLGQTDVPISVEIITQVVAGGMLGLLVGAAQVRAERNAEAATQAQLEQEFLERQRETNEVLNRILRHHLLNGLTVIRGQAEILRDHVDEEADDRAANVLDRASQMATTIEEISDITRALTEKPTLVETDVVALVESELQEARETYPEAAFALVNAPAGATVAADDLLGRALANVLNNAVDHNDDANPRVEVAVREGAADVRVTVGDNGSGFSDSVEGEVFEPSERGIDSTGEGLGLFLTASVVTQYGGDVWIEDAPPAPGDDPWSVDGAFVTLSVPRPEE